MNLTNSSEPMGGEHQSVNFKVENPHDLMYYQVPLLIGNLSKNVHFTQLILDLWVMWPDPILLLVKFSKHKHVSREGVNCDLIYSTGWYQLSA